MLAAFQSLRLREEVPRIIERTDNELITLNQKQLFDYSLDSEAEPIGLYRSLFYSIEKQQRNPRPGFGRPDLYDTGDFYNGFYVEVKSDSYLIYSRDSKANLLTEKYGDNIFGLNPTSKQQYVNETLYPSIAAYITAKTGLVLR